MSPSRPFHATTYTGTYVRALAINECQWMTVHTCTSSWDTQKLPEEDVRAAIAVHVDEFATYSVDYSSGSSITVHAAAWDPAIPAIKLTTL